jgi:hypothetical protein
MSAQSITVTNQATSGSLPRSNTVLAVTNGVKEFVFVEVAVNGPVH